MKRLLFALSLALCLFALAACGSRHYSVVMNDGKEYVATAKPDYNSRSETYDFEDLDGRAVTVKREDVRVIQERKQ